MILLERNSPGHIYNRNTKIIKNLVHDKGCLNQKHHMYGVFTVMSLKSLQRTFKAM